MARTSPTVTENEIQAYVKFCADHNICNDDSGTPESIANAELVGKYFLETWPNDITEVNLGAAFPLLKPYLKFYSSRQQAEYTEIANQNQHAAQTLVAWLNTQGKPGQLVNQPPEAYENLSLLLIELRGREINRKTISEAEGRISYKPGRQLHYVPLPRQQNPRQHQDDGEPFLGRDVNLTPAQHRERARAAYAEPPKESASTIRGREQAAAQRDAEAMRGSTHSETNQIEKLFVVDQTTHEIDWVRTRDARRQMQQLFERRKAVSR